MDIKEIAKLLKAKIHHVPDGVDIDIAYAGAADLMSDVLAYMSEMPHQLTKDMILITGLVNLQTIRTADLMDISAIIFTRGKVPAPEIIDEAKKINVAILSTNLTSYYTSGLLYSAGIQGLDKEASRV